MKQYELHIDTSRNQTVYLALVKAGELIVESVFDSEYSQAEKLLPEIETLLKKANVDLAEIKKITVANKGEGFTALRIGIITANALAYALQIPVYDKFGKSVKKEGISLVKPKYSKEPNITLKKSA